MSIKRHVQTMMREQVNKWVVPPLSTAFPYDLAYIGLDDGTGGGNDISPTGYTGIKKIGTALSSIATYDLSTHPATVDGIGWGWHYRLGRLVLILNDSRSGIGHDIPASAPVFIARSPVGISSQACYVIALT